MQLVRYIALPALLEQGSWYLLAGLRRQQNSFRGLLQLVSKPFTAGARAVTSAQVSDARVPLVMSLLLLLLLLLVLVMLLLLVRYAVVTLERASLCVAAQWVGQAGHR